ncbi:MAG: beta-lactamase family protein [Clostridiales bacterium]|jgi:CubicO group peptidase (beta-lactamase class C family)|nr:beta-lactamase family protein [Clostridiales bacterium]
MRDFNRTREAVIKGQETGVYPGAALSSGDAGGELFRMHCGFRSYFPSREPMLEDTLFDVASMTKIMSTTMVALLMLQDGRLNLSYPLTRFFDCPPDKGGITVWHLMTHTSGLPAHEELWKRCRTPDAVTAEILGLGLLYAPGTGVTYSCLGYILLGKICEFIGGKSLDILAREMVFNPLGMNDTGYNPADKDNAASTEFSVEINAYKKGIVHDENAWFLGGVSGNAGLFSTISDCAVYAVMLANRGAHNGREFINRDLFNEAMRNHTPGLEEGRGLGFVVKAGLPSSAGNVFPDGSYGHTGYTGTSVWVDCETGQYTVFLTNRVHPTRENGLLVQYRKEVNDMSAKDYREI